MTDTGSVEQAELGKQADADDVDALLAQVDTLVDEAANSVIGQPAQGAESSASEEAVSASSLTTPEDPVRVDRVVNPAGEINSTLDDLDNLLQELGEKPTVEPEVQPEDNAATPTEADHAAEGKAESVPDQADANPYANEVAQMEQQWAAEAARNGHAVPASVSSATPEAAKVSQPAPAGMDEAAAEGERPLLLRVLDRFAAPVASLLEILDIPFTRLSPRLKNVIGYAGFATMAVAVALWFAGPYLIHLPILTASSASISEGESSDSEASPSEAKAASGGSHSSAKASKSSGGGGHSAAKESKSSGGGGHSAAKESKSSGGGGHSAAKESKSSGGGGHSAAKESKSSGGGGHSSAKKAKSSGKDKHAPEKKSH